MNTEALDLLRDILPPRTTECDCYLCRISEEGCRPQDAPNLLMTAGELVASLKKLPQNAPVVVEMYAEGKPHIGLIRSTYRDQEAPTVVLIAVEKIGNPNNYV
jgi:hypothetical protein